MARPTSEIPGPRLPRPLQTLLGVGRPMAARLAMRRRYGRLFRTNDVFAGQMIHVADRALIEEMFKWKPAQYNVSEPRQIMEPVTGPESILLLDGDRRASPRCPARGYPTRPSIRSHLCGSTGRPAPRMHVQVRSRVRIVRAARPHRGPQPRLQISAPP